MAPLAQEVPGVAVSARKASATLHVDVADVKASMIFGALYGLAESSGSPDIRDIRTKVVRAANAAWWAVPRADPLERTMDPQTLIDFVCRPGEDYSPHREAWEIEAVDDVSASLQERIDGERMGATPHHWAGRLLRGR